MENKSDIKGILLVVSIVISLLLALFVIYDKVLKKENCNCPKNDCQCEKCMKYENGETLDIVSVRYSSGGGYGTRITTASKTITITESEVKFSNSYNDYVETYNMEKNKFNELVAHINNNKSIFTDGVNEGRGQDGKSSHITIVLKNGEERKTGGYMIEDKTYEGIVNKIYSMIDREKFAEYIKNIS